MPFKLFPIALALLIISGCASSVTAPSPAHAEEAVAQTPASGQCPQPRKTLAAPASFLKMQNSKTSPADIKNGGELYHKTAKPFTCETCHGAKGDGLGDPDFESTPPARNFTCKATMNALKDGQLFWIIKNGSKDTSMPPFGGSLSDDDIWRLVAYIRGVSN